MVDFEWYRSFLAIYQSGTVTGAAEARTLTQPAVTQHLAALESVIGEPLFVRTPRKMVATERGQILYNELVAALEKLETVSQHLKQALSPEIASLRLGTPIEYFQEILTPNMSKLERPLQIKFGVAEELVLELKGGLLDLIIAAQRVNIAEIEYQKLDEENFVLVSSADYPTLPENISPKELEKWLLTQSWISYGVELPIIRRFWRQSFNHRPAIRPIIIVPNLQSIRQLVIKGLGISLLPQYLCKAALENGQLKLLWQPPNPVRNELWLAYRKTERNSLSTSYLINRIKQWSSFSDMI